MEIFDGKAEVFFHKAVDGYLMACRVEMGDGAMIAVVSSSISCDEARNEFLQIRLTIQRFFDGIFELYHGGRILVVEEVGGVLARMV